MNTTVHPAAVSMQAARFASRVIHADEPVVGRDEIRRLARDAADKQIPLHQANPYAVGTRAHCSFEHAYWERERWLSGEESC